MIASDAVNLEESSLTLIYISIPTGYDIFTPFDLLGMYQRSLIRFSDLRVRSLTCF